MIGGWPSSCARDFVAHRARSAWRRRTDPSRRACSSRAFRRVAQSGGDRPGGAASGASCAMPARSNSGKVPDTPDRSAPQQPVVDRIGHADHQQRADRERGSRAPTSAARRTSRPASARTAPPRTPHWRAPAPHRPSSSATRRLPPTIGTRRSGQAIPRHDPGRRDQRRDHLRVLDDHRQPIDHDRRQRDEQRRPRRSPRPGPRERAREQAEAEPVEPRAGRTSIGGVPRAPAASISAHSRAMTGGCQSS